ncbi:MAG TPA: peptidoglycan-binding domain-containing protein [Chthoniobacterales bacterium]|jgi:hypothetical protein
MKLTTLLSVVFASALFALATPAQAQHRVAGHAPVAVARGGGFHGGSYHGGYYHGYPGHYYWHGRNYAGFYFGGFGYPFYGYPYWGYPYYYGYNPYYGAPEQGYTYDPQGVYNGRLANGNAGHGSLTAQVQRELAAAGYYRGAIDGIAGEGTRRAIRNFQRDNGMAVDGRVTEELLQRPPARG